MTTRPKHDHRSIAIDGRRVLEAARSDLSNAQFKQRVSKHDCDVLAANIDALESADGGTSTSLHSVVAAGVHASEVRAALATKLADVRDDARLAFPKDAALQHAFGVGADPNVDSTSQMLHVADTVLHAAHTHSEEAARIGLDAHGIRNLEDLIHSLQGADTAHVQTRTARHEQTVLADSLAHVVSAAIARVRIAARRVFRDDATHLERYANTLPRHAVKPRAHANAPAAEPAKV